MSSIDELPAADMTQDAEQQAPVISDMNTCSACQASDPDCREPVTLPDNLQYCAQCKRSFCDVHVQVSETQPSHRLDFIAC